MQKDTDIYTNFGISPLSTMLVVSVLVFFIVIRLAGSRILKNLTLRKQAKEISLSKNDIDAKINEAIAKIRQIQSQLATKSITGKDAAFQVSQITRETYDLAMNHTTKYQSKHEAGLRNLQHITTLLDSTYLPEFNPKSPEINTENEIFNKAIGALESCR